MEFIPPMDKAKIELSAYFSLSSLSEKKRREVYRKLGAVYNYIRLINTSKNIGDYKATYTPKMICASLNVGERTMRRWIKIYNDQGIVGLVDTRGGTAVSDED